MRSRARVVLFYYRCTRYALRSLLRNRMCFTRVVRLPRRDFRPRSDRRRGSFFLLRRRVGYAPIISCTLIVIPMMYIYNYIYLTFKNGCLGESRVRYNTPMRRLAIIFQTHFCSHFNSNVPIPMCHTYNAIIILIILKSSKYFPLTKHQ